MLKHGILGLLNYGSMTGYDIVRIFKDSLSYFWQAQTSQIYRELQTIKKKMAGQQMKPFCRTASLIKKYSPLPKAVNRN